MQEEDPGVSSPWSRFPLPRKALSFSKVKGDVHGPMCGSEPPIFPMQPGCIVTQIYPKEGAGALGWSHWGPSLPTHLLPWSSCPFPTWSLLILPFQKASAGSGLGLASFWLWTSPGDSSQGKPVGNGICPRPPSPSMGNVSDCPVPPPGETAAPYCSGSVRAGASQLGIPKSQRQFLPRAVFLSSGPSV